MVKQKTTKNTDLDLVYETPEIIYEREILEKNIIEYLNNKQT